MSDEKVLTKEIAEQFSADEDSVDLNEFTAIEDAAAESLSKHEGEWTTEAWLLLDGLTELSDAAAESLSKHKGDGLRLNGLTELSDAAAEVLSNYEGDVALSGLSQLSDSAAVSLSKHKGCLSLSGLTHLSFAAAQMIIGKEVLTESNAETLMDSGPCESCGMNGSGIALEEYTLIEDAAAVRLGEGPTYYGDPDPAIPDIYLDSLISLSAAAAEGLSKCEGDLRLNGLTELSNAAAESLSKYEGNLSIGLTSLSDAAAESLSQHTGTLVLNGLTELSDVAAQSLSKHKDDLNLLGLTELSDAAAESLSKHEGILNINLDNLPASAAGILRNHPSFAEEDDDED